MNDNIDIDIGNKTIMFIRVNNRLYNIKDVNFVQIDPNTGKITQDIPLSKPINKLMWFNNGAFEKPIEDWQKLFDKSDK